jgi:hypothetical protein
MAAYDEVSVKVILNSDTSPMFGYGIFLSNVGSHVEATRHHNPKTTVDIIAVKISNLVAKEFFFVNK